MAIIKIVGKDDPILRKTSRRVDEITPRIIKLLEDMKDTLRDAEGAGLAAVQVGVLRRIVLVETEPGELIEMINPEIIETEGVQENLEGCLSVPDVWGITSRPAKVTVRAQNRKGEYFTVSGTGLKARAFCHELDHLDGKLFTDCSIKLMSTEEMQKMMDKKKN